MAIKHSDKMFYTVSFEWNRTLWVMTFAVFGLWIGFSGYLLYEIFTQEAIMESLIALIVLNVIMLPTIILCEGFAPQRLEIGKDKIVVLRRYGSVVLEREMIKSIERLPENVMRGAIRTCGVGGIFGYFGHYYTRKIGSFKLYATSFQNLYLIRKWDGRSIVISCAEPDKMGIFSQSMKS